MDRLQGRIRTAYYAGDTDYDGQTQSGAAIDSSTDQKIWDVSALAAYRLPFSSAPRTSLYVGGGYRHWRRDIQSVGAISGLDETYRWWSAQTGLNLEWRRGANLWMLDGRLTRTLNPQAAVDFQHTFDSADLDLGERWGWMAEFAWRHKLSPPTECRAQELLPELGSWQKRAADLDCRRHSRRQRLSTPSREQKLWLCRRSQASLVNMKRIPEAELMDGPEQALAYARADFSEPHNRFVALFRERFGSAPPGNSVLDLGCGPGDICRRFARAFPAYRIHAVDASEAMLTLAQTETDAQALNARIEYFLAYLPDARLPLQSYDVLISNSLLHHLKDPATLWRSLVEYGRPGALVFVMDLLRPDSHKQAEQLLEDYAGNEPEILRKDFFNSLLAAYRPDEVTLQLQQQGIDQLQIEVVSDRHFIVFGHL